MNNSTLQFLRKANLIVADASGDGLNLSNLRIIFKIKKTDTGTPNSALIRVYNLSDSTIKKIKNEFTTVQLDAGYSGNIGLIFIGNIKQISFGRESETDTYVDISAGDGDEAHNFSFVNKTLASGASPFDQINSIIKPMNVYGVTLGFVDNLGGVSLPRGKVLYGMCKDHLDEVSKSTQSTWSIQNKKVQVVLKTSTLPSDLIVLNSKTGMIGTPIQTNDGIKIRSLLNPLIKVAGKVQINNRDIADAKIEDSDIESQVNSAPSMSADGIYRVLVVDFVGDNRGNDWYSEMTCLAIDETAPDEQQVRIT